MGMTCSLHLVSPEELEKFKAGKLRANKFLVQTMNDEANLVYLDKAWQIIHFGLSGEEWDCNDAYGAAIMGGEALGSSETEKLLDQELVSEVAKVLEPIGEAEFKEMLLSRDLEDAELYCFDYDSLDEDVDYATSHYLTLRAAYLKAASMACGVVVSIS